MSDGPIVSMWGTFDVDNFGDHLYPRIARLELERRGCRLKTYAPMGWDHPARMDAGDPAEPLGPYEPARLDALTTAGDAVLVGGGDIVHTRDESLAPHYAITEKDAKALKASRFFIDGLGRQRERSCPVLWHAVGVPSDPSAADAKRIVQALKDRPYVAVRDVRSRLRLEAAGVDREITVVPDSGFLIPRLLSRGVLEKRLAYLRVMGGFPTDGPAIVVQGNRDLVPFAAEIASSLRAVVSEHPGLAIVITETSRGDGDADFAEALAHHLGGIAARVSGLTSVEDVAATIAAAQIFVGASYQGNVAAAAYDRPQVMLNLAGQSKLEGLADALQRPEALVENVSQLTDAILWGIEKPPRRDVVVRLQAAVDDHFDRVVEIASRAALARRDRAHAPTSGDELAALRRATEQLTRRTVAERVVMADRVVDLEEQLSAATATIRALEAQGAWLAERLSATEAAATWHRSNLAAVEAELDAIKETKTFRWTSPAREFLIRWRSRRP